MAISTKSSRYCFNNTNICKTRFFARERSPQNQEHNHAIYERETLPWYSIRKSLVEHDRLSPDFVSIEFNRPQQYWRTDKCGSDNERYGMHCNYFSTSIIALFFMKDELPHVPAIRTQPVQQRNHR